MWRRYVSRVPGWVWWIIGVLLFLWMVGELLLWVLLRPENPMTVQDVEQLIQRECPIGSSRSQVTAFIDKYCSHKFPRAREIGCRIEDTARSLGVVSDIVITFYFDDSDKLVRYEVEEQFTGL